MDNLEILRTSFVALVDGMWWGLRDNTGPLSMYEGYERGFRQIGSETAEKLGGKGPNDAAKVAGQIMEAIGMKVEVDGTEVNVKECPLWNRILEKGLEFAFHVEEICWKPMLEGIGEKLDAKPKVGTSLRLNHIAMAKIEYKKAKAMKAAEKGSITKDELDQAIEKLEQDETKIASVGQYRFE